MMPNRIPIQEPNPNPNPNPNPSKRKRNLPGTPDPDAEVIALSPKSLMATNRFLCEICNKGFQRDQNLQLHRRGHNLPWKLKQRASKEIKKKVYLCPVKTCVHHDPARALGDLTGVKKHYSRKHGEKKWKCEKCSKKYAVQSDWKAHSKICGTREYKCDCGTLFSRKDSFITHRAFCDALAEESCRVTSIPAGMNLNLRNELVNGTLGGFQQGENPQFSAMFRPELAGTGLPEPTNMDGPKSRLPLWLDHNSTSHLNQIPMAGNVNSFLGSSSTSMAEDMFGLSAQAEWLKEDEDNKGNLSNSLSSLYYNSNNNQSHHGNMSATALLQKAATMGSTTSNPALFGSGFAPISLSNMASFGSLNQSKNEVVQNFAGQANHDPNYASSTTVISNNEEILLSSEANTRQPNNLMMMGKRSRSSFNEGEGSQTRDFLGVGASESRPFLQQELAKLASMGSAMDFNQYNGGHRVL
ncbi:hypothetical protein LguiA_012229 [Lonicera macranthoides]